MPPSVITTSGSSTIVTASALSYPANADPLTYLPYDTPQLITSSGAWRHPKPGFPINLYCVLIGGGGGGGGRNTSSQKGGSGGGSGYIQFIELSNVIANITATIGAGGAGATAEDLSGSTGGTTTFSTGSIAGGAGGGPDTGGAGALGGGGGGTNDPGMSGGGGGEGTYIGGGGGGGGIAGSLGGESTYPTIAKATLLNAGNGRVTYGGYPNGARGTNNTGAGGYGGQPWIMFPYLRTYGVGGNGNAGGGAGDVGTKGCVAIFYQRPN